MKHLDNIPDADIAKMNIPTGIPLVYEFDANMRPVKHYYIGNPDAVKKAMDNVAKQGTL